MPSDHSQADDLYGLGDVDRHFGGFRLGLGEALDEPPPDSPPLQYDPGALPADLDEETIRFLYEAVRARVLAGRGPSVIRLLEQRMAELSRKDAALENPNVDTYRRALQSQDPEADAPSAPAP